MPFQTSYITADECIFFQHRRRTIYQSQSRQKVAEGAKLHATATVSPSIIARFRVLFDNTL
eukprot:757389-Hanusia_phi.AAC.6